MVNKQLGTLVPTPAEAAFLKRQRELNKLEPWQRDMVNAVGDDVVRSVVADHRTPTSLPVVPATGSGPSVAGRVRPISAVPGLAHVDAIGEAFARQDREAQELRALELAERRERLRQRAREAAAEAADAPKGEPEGQPESLAQPQPAEPKSLPLTQALARPPTGQPESLTQPQAQGGLVRRV